MGVLSVMGRGGGLSPTRRAMTMMAILTVLAVCLAACGNSPRPSTGSPATASLPTISVTTFPTSPFLSVWVAEKEHFDTQRGIRIQEDVTTGGATLYTPIVGGQADTSIILPDVTELYASKGVIKRGTGKLAVLPAFTCVSTPAHPATAIVGANDIASVSDLNGKVIATHNLTSGFYLSADLTLATEHVKPAHVVVLPMSQMGEAMHLGQISAGIMDYYDALATVAQGDGHILQPVLGAGQWANYPYCAWVFNRGFYTSHFAVVRAFMLSMLDANNWILHHEDAAKQILVDHMGTPSELAKKFISQFPLDKFTTTLNLNLADTPLTRLADGLQTLGVIPRAIPASAIYEPQSVVSGIQSAWKA